MLGCLSCAQEKTNDRDYQAVINHKNNSNFFDALRLRTDLNYNTQKRILYTTLSEIDIFGQNYKQTNMTLEYVIRDRLHTAIFLNQEKNFLESMDGSRFSLPQNVKAPALTDAVVNLIGGMYYGAAEVRALAQ